MIELVALFGAGVASFIAPCVLPLVPIYLGVLGSSSVGSSARLVGSTLAFVGGFAGVFALLGSLAGTVGSVDATAGWLRVGCGVAVVATGAALAAGRLDRSWQPLIGWLERTATGPGGAALAGAGFGAAWTPCVGPLLGLALGTAVVEGRPLWGAALLLAFGLGLGTPLIVLSLAASGTPRFLDAARRIGHRVQPIAGVTMVVLGVLLVTNRYAELVSRVDGWLPQVDTL